MPSHPHSTDAYRALILRRDATEILLSPQEASGRLPRVEIPKHQRVAELLNKEIRKAWNLETFCLLVLSSGATDPSAEAGSAVVECVKQSQRAPAGTYWMPVSAAVDYCVVEESAAIRDALKELSAYTSGEKPGPFANPGWQRELFDWVYEQSAPLGLRLTSGFQQYNASPTFSLVRLETDGAAMWFKATGEPNAHELPVTLLLAELFPD